MRRPGKLDRRDAPRRSADDVSAAHVTGRGLEEDTLAFPAEIDALAPAGDSHGVADDAGPSGAGKRR